MPCERRNRGAVAVTSGSFRAAWLRGFGQLLTVRVARRASSSDWWGVGGISVHTRGTALQRRLTYPCLETPSPETGRSSRAVPAAAHEPTPEFALAAPGRSDAGAALVAERLARVELVFVCPAAAHPQS